MEGEEKKKMIYFIQAGENAVKIGWTESIERRYGKLQTANYEKLKILYLFKGGRKLEKELLGLAHKYRIRGEWFDNKVLKDTQITDIAKKQVRIELIKKTKKEPPKAIPPSTNVKKEREARGWSQEFLAVKCNVSKQSVDSWERGGNIHKKNNARLKQVFKWVKVKI